MASTESEIGHMPAGRPTKYRRKFCQTVIEVGSYGGWLCEMAEACDVHRSTMDEWAAQHPEFSDALNRAKQKAQQWFEQQAREGLRDRDFNAALWKHQMASRHRGEYSDLKQVELTGKDGGPVQTEDVTKRDADAFTRSIAGLAAGDGTGEAAGGTEPGDKGQA